MNPEVVISKKWFIQFRWYLSALCVGSYVAALKLHFIDHSSVLLALTGIILISNIAIDRLIKDKITDFLLFILILLDTAIITIGLYHTGGASNPFSILYLAYVVFCAMLLSKKKTTLITIVTNILYGGLLIVPQTTHHHHHTSSYNSHLIGMWFAYSLVAIIGSLSISNLANTLKITLRERESLLSKQKRLRSITTLAAGAAHELRTPLNTMYLLIEELKEHITTNASSEETIHAIAELETQVQRCTTILSDLNANSGTLEAEKRTSTSIISFLNLLKAEINSNILPHIVFLSPQKDLTIAIPQKTLLRAINSIIVNAYESRPNVQIKFSIEIDDHMIAFQIEDNGPGIEEDILNQIGEPFVTNKPLGNGMGLGFFLSKIATQSYGGDVQIIKSNQNGTIIRISIKR